MRTIMLLTVVATAFAFSTPAQPNIEGIWLTENGDMKVEIYRKADSRYGRIVWLKEPTDKNGQPVKDENNPDKSVRSRPVMGIDLLQTLQYREGKWQGSLYAPKRGLTMDVEVVLTEGDKLRVSVTYRGFEREQTWVRSSI